MYRECTLNTYFYFKNSKKLYFLYCITFASVYTIPVFVAFISCTITKKNIKVFFLSYYELLLLFFNEPIRSPPGPQKKYIK